MLVISQALQAYSLWPEPRGGPLRPVLAECLLRHARPRRLLLSWAMHLMISRSSEDSERLFNSYDFDYFMFL